MTRFIAVVSGKGGVGKTTFTIGVGQALLQQGRSVILLDANLVTPNLALHLGYINPANTINQFLKKEKELKEIIYLHESGLSLIPASPSYQEYLKTNPQKLAEVFEHVDKTADFVLIDAPSGLGYEVNHILKNSDEALIVVTPTLSSVLDALKTIQLAQSHNNIIAGVILNLTHWSGQELSPKEVEEILGQKILANVRDDRKVRKAQHKNNPVNYIYPRCRTARELQKVAQHLSLEIPV